MEEKSIYDYIEKDIDDAKQYLYDTYGYENVHFVDECIDDGIEDPDDPELEDYLIEHSVRVWDGEQQKEFYVDIYYQQSNGIVGDIRVTER